MIHYIYKASSKPSSLSPFCFWLKVLLSKGASVLARDEDGAVPLHDAAASGFTDCVTLLLNAAEQQGCVEEMLKASDVDGDTVCFQSALSMHKPTTSYPSISCCFRRTYRAVRQPYILLENLEGSSQGRTLTKFFVEICFLNLSISQSFLGAHSLQP